MTLADTKHFAANLLAVCEMIESVGMPELDKVYRTYESSWMFIWHKDDENNAYINVNHFGFVKCFLRVKDSCLIAEGLTEETRAALLRAKAMMEGEG